MQRLTTEEQNIRHGNICPECGSTDTMQRDGQEYRCCTCDHGWGFDGEWYGISDTLADKIDRVVEDQETRLYPFEPTHETWEDYQ